MNQKNLISIIILDVIVMLMAIGLIVFRYSSLTGTAVKQGPTAIESEAPPDAEAPQKSAVPASEGTSSPLPSGSDSVSADASAAADEILGAPPTESDVLDSGDQLVSKASSRKTAVKTTMTGEARHIGFAYRNSKVKKVEIIGDFNDWNPASMKKGANHTWSVTVDIVPGEYAYNFVVDGKPVRDPNNPKICNVGRGFPNSFLKVKPRAHDKKKAR